MARSTRSDRQHQDLARARSTRTGRLWLGLVPALVVLILLIIFIAQNGQHVQVQFLGASGHIALALALLIAAVVGAVIVLLVGSARILQLRRATRRHERHAGSPAVAPSLPAQPLDPDHEP